MVDLFGQAEAVTRHATFAHEGQLRLTLTRRWVGGPHVCFIGHNPSTADHQVDDPTVRRWMHFARAWGYAGFVAVNLYPIRATDPAEARRWIDWQANGPDWHARDAIFQNHDVLIREAKAAALVVACWGAIARDQDWVEHVLENIATDVAPYPAVHVFDLTKDGAPIHPMARGRMRVPDDAKPVLWRKGG